MDVSEMPTSAIGATPAAKHKTLWGDKENEVPSMELQVQHGCGICVKDRGAAAL